MGIPCGCEGCEKIREGKAKVEELLDTFVTDSLYLDSQNDPISKGDIISIILGECCLDHWIQGDTVEEQYLGLNNLLTAISTQGMEDIVQAKKERLENNGD